MAAAASNQNDNMDSSVSLGNDLRGLRKSRGITLTELSEKIGRSVGFISQVERGISSPSIEDLRAFTSALEVPIGWFFVNDSIEENERGLIVRADSRRSLGTQESGIVEELLSPDLGGAFEMFHTVIEPGAALENEVQRESEEAGFVVSGKLDLWIEDELFHLKAGDSFRFDHKPYRWRNPGTKQVVIVWVVSPPVY